MDKTQNKITATRAVTTSIIVSVGDILFNLIVAAVTGSVVILAQALQGTADLITALLLLLGVKRSAKKTSVRHPLGHGREVFFWTLLASIFALFVTGGVAIWRGFDQILSPGSIEFTTLAYGMLIFGFITNAYSLNVSLHRLAKGAGKNKFFDYLLRSSLVETKTSMLVDLMGTLAAILGIIAIALFDLTGNVAFDGIGAVSVGLLTAVGAGFLVYNLRGFIVGQSPGQDVIERIRKTAMNTKHVQDVLDLRAITTGSEQIFVILEVHFSDGLDTDQIEEATDQIKADVKEKIPAVHRIQVEAETPDKEV